MSVVGEKTTPVGIDSKIQSLQNKLYDDLSASDVWNNTDYDSYGRAYRIPKKDDTHELALYLGSDEYSTLYIDDTKPAISFFFVQDTESYDVHKFVSTVDIIFFVNLSTLKASITHRADVEVREDVYEVLRTEPLGFRIQSLVVGVENVFSGMGISKYDDLQPYHIFKFVTQVNHR